MLWFGGGGEEGPGTGEVLRKAEGTAHISKVGIAQSKGCREVNVTEQIVVGLLRFGFESYDKLGRMSPRTWRLYSPSRRTTRHRASVQMMRLL